VINALDQISGCQVNDLDEVSLGQRSQPPARVHSRPRYGIRSLEQFRSHRSAGAAVPQSDLLLCREDSLVVPRHDGIVGGAMGELGLDAWGQQLAALHIDPGDLHLLGARLILPLDEDK
jgi:hypothetical protein